MIPLTHGSTACPAPDPGNDPTQPRADHLPRPEAQAAVKALCREALDTQTPLSALVARDFPQIDAAVFDPSRQLGQAPQEATAFAAAVRTLI